MELFCRECEEYAGNGMYCAENYLVYDFSVRTDHCDSDRVKCTYEKENGKPPTCTHECKGCMWNN